MNKFNEIKLQKVRYEQFGGIIGLTKPPALLFVDREYMKEEGYFDSPLWHENQTHLSAPTEVHFNVTNQCPLRCRHCTSGSDSSIEHMMSTQQIKDIIDTLAEMKVFHIAFGGGELFSRNDAIELAKYAAMRGVVPNATTNGYYMTPELAKECTIFGQINISMDGIAQNYGAVRGCDNYEKADRAISLLKENGVKTGLNCMVTKANFDMLEEVVAYAHKLELEEVLFLRLKPSGRAREIYEDFKLTGIQGKMLFPFLVKMSKRYKPQLLVDCSFIPHISSCKPSKKMMKMFGIEGCEGGNILMGIRHDGWINACSHYGEYLDNKQAALPELWNKHEHFRRFRERRIIDERCLKCGYFKICRGGCPLFSEFITGDFNAPDPECPRLV